MISVLIQINTVPNLKIKEIIVLLVFKTKIQKISPYHWFKLKIKKSIKKGNKYKVEILAVIKIVILLLWNNKILITQNKVNKKVFKFKLKKKLHNKKQLR